MQSSTVNRGLAFSNKMWSSDIIADRLILRRISGDVTSGAVDHQLLRDIARISGCDRVFLYAIGRVTS